MTYLNVKGRDWKSSRWGNGNTSSGWKNRVEYGVTASKGVTKLSLIMNTSVILPPISWTLPVFGEGSPKKNEKSRSKSSKRGSFGSSSRSNSSRSSHSSRGSRESGRSRREEIPERLPPRIKEPRSQALQIEERDHRHRHSRERRKRRPNVDPGFIDSLDAQ
ncbi:hypothetical protein IFR05_010251 [Cadophora sp. M221]|nr:hypothetical protein IFR05_010251 [Cadophora sp. M221]